MISYLKSQANIIHSETGLALYGAFLSFTHIATFLHWNAGNFFINSQSSINSEPLCFPIFPNCDLFRDSLSAQMWMVILCLYLFISLITVFLFLNREALGWAFGLLTFLNVFKLGLHLSNYNFMGNYHYMVYIVSFLYLFLPHKKLMIKCIIVAFYLAAGCLKFNVDWLSGAALIAPAFIQGKFLTVSLYYVVFLEMVLVFGLLSQTTWIRWVTLIQLTTFHIFSWHIVGFYYPTIMFCLLSLFFIDEFYNLKYKLQAPDYLRGLLSGQEPRQLYVVLILFTLMQVIPYIYVRDPSLSGALRLTSLNMFDSKTECQSLMIAHKEKASIHIDSPLKNLGTRLRCDPLIFLNQAHQLCRRNKIHPEFTKLSFSLMSKRTTDIHYHKILDIADICQMRNPLWAEFGSVRFL